MSKIEQLLKKHCPDGVEYKPLGEVAKICRGVRVVKKELSSTGAYEVFQNSLKPLGLYGEANVKGGTAFVIGAGAAGEVGYSVNDFWAADDCYYIDGGEWLIGRYVYYCLTSRQAWLSSKVRKASIPRLSRDLVSALEVPLPPIEIQREVVEVLDKFALLEAELEAELAKRKKQYEHYRRALLCRRGVPTASEKEGELSIQRGEDTASTSDWPRVKLGEILVSYDRKRVPLSSAQRADKKGPYRYFGAQGVVDYIDEYIYDGRYMLIAEDGENLRSCKLPIAQIVEGQFWVNNHAHVVQTNELASLDYVCYVLNTMDIGGYITGAAQPKLNQANLNSIEIPLPPLKEQRKVVSILDRFDALCNSLSEGLPAEIERRKKQYAYYRDKLLDFKRKGAA